MNRRYSAQQGSRIELAYFNEAGAAPVASVARGPSDVVINVPIQVSGVTPGSMIIPRALKATLEAPDGTHWTSFWQPIDTDRLLLAAIGTGAPTAVRSLRAPFSVPRSLYEKVKAMPLRLRIVLAIERARQGSTTTVTLPLNDFQVPLVGICTPQTNYYKPGEIGGIACRAALRPPRLTFVRISWSYDDCHKPGEERHNVDGEAWVGSLEQPPAEFAIAPIWADLIAFSNRQPDYRIDQPRHICPGTPAIFTTYEAAGRTQAALDISGFVLPELSQGQMTVIAKP
jgi:hypothetical protein